MKVISAVVHVISRHNKPNDGLNLVWIGKTTLLGTGARDIVMFTDEAEGPEDRASVVRNLWALNTLR